MKDNKTLISVLHRQVQHTCTLTPPCTGTYTHIKPHVTIQTRTRMQGIGRRIFYEKMYEIQIIVRSNLLEHELILKMYFVCMDVFGYMHVYRVYAVPMEARRGLQMS